jgi:hypothetical protein
MVFPPPRIQKADSGPSMNKPVKIGERIGQRHCPGVMVFQPSSHRIQDSPGRPSKQGNGPRRGKINALRTFGGVSGLGRKEGVAGLLFSTQQSIHANAQPIQGKDAKV